MYARCLVLASGFARCAGCCCARTWAQRQETTYVTNTGLISSGSIECFAHPACCSRLLSLCTVHVYSSMYKPYKPIYVYESIVLVAAS
jgi:hypothetical protein